MNRRETDKTGSFRRFLNNIKGRAFWINVVYLVIGSAWIIISDILSKAFFEDSSDLVLVSIIKGLVYVIVTGLVIFTMIYKALKRRDERREKSEPFDG